MRHVGLSAFALGVCLLCVGSASASTYTWVPAAWYNPGTGNWTESTYWTGGAGYPGQNETTDTAMFNVSPGGWYFAYIPRTVVLNSSQTVAAVQISGPTPINFQNAGATLTTSGFTVTSTEDSSGSNWNQFDPVLAGAAPVINQGDLYLTNAGNSFTGTINVNGGALIVNSSDGILGNAGNTINLGSAGRIGGLGVVGTETRAITLSGLGGVMVAQANAAETWNGVVSGSGMLIVDTSVGINYLNGNNTYSGGTIVASGIIRAGTTSVAGTYGFGTGNVVITGSGLMCVTSNTNFAPGASVLVDNVGVNGGLRFLADVMPNIDSASSGTLHFLGGSGGGFDPEPGSPTGAALADGTHPIGNGQMFVGVANGWYQADSMAALVANDPTHTYKLGDTAQTQTNYQRMVVDSPDFYNTTGELRDLTAAPYNVQIGRSGVWSQAVAENILLMDKNTFSGTLTVNFRNALVAFSNWNWSGGNGLGGAGNIVLNGEGTSYSDYGDLKYASLSIIAQNSNTALNSKGDLSFTSGSGVALSGSSTNIAQLTVASLTRANKGTLGVNAINGNLGNGENLLVAGGLTPVNGMVSPVYWNTRDNEFLSYDNSRGFVKTSAQLSSLAAAAAQSDGGAGSIVYTGSDTVAGGGQSVYALKTTGVISGGTLTVGDGTNPAGVIFAGGGTQTANFAFGGSEGIVYTPANTTINGTLSGTGGLTKSGRGNLILGGANTGLSGTFAVNQGTVSIAADNNLGAGDLYLDGGGLNFDNTGFCTKNIVLGPSGGWLNYSQSLFMANNPGAGSQYGGTTPSTSGYSGNITGSGGLYVTNEWLGSFGHGGQGNNNWVCIMGTGNTYTGGTFVNGNSVRLKVGSGSSLGTGDLIVGFAQSDSNVNSDVVDLAGNCNLSRVYLQEDGSVLSVGGKTSGTGAGTNSIGSLEGVGEIVMGQMADIYPEFSGSNTLTIGINGDGSNGVSTDYFGRIIDAISSLNDNLTKVGTGTLTLWGENTYSGTTTVKNGTLVNNNLISGSVTVQPGAAGQTPTYTGSGTTLGNVDVFAGGHLTGSGRINGEVYIHEDGAEAVMTGAVIKGGFEMDGGSYSGTSTLGDSANGHGFEMLGGTFSGTHTINMGAGIFLVGGSLGGTNTITTPVVDVEDIMGTGSTFSSGGSVTIPAGAGNGFYLDQYGYGGGSVTGSATINGDVYVWGGSFAGNHTIVGNVQIGDYNNYGYAPVFSGASQITGNVTVGSRGTFQGNHTIHGSFTTAAGSHAIVASHNDALSAGTLTVVGDVTLDHSTMLNFNLASPGTIGSGISDLIDITGNLSLDGTLNVTNLSGFGAGTYRLFNYTGTLSGAGTLLQGTMPADYHYTIDTSTTGQVNLGVVLPWILGDTDRSGTLNSFDIDAIYHHFGQAYTTQWKVYPDTNPVSQEDVTYELTHYFHTNYGDANLDRFTDFTDFQVLLDHWQAPGGWAQGDFNGDGVVDFLDFQVLLDYWNPGGWNAGASQVPEPATLSLLALGGLALLRRSRE